MGALNFCQPMVYQVFFFGQLQDDLIVQKFEAYAKGMQTALSELEKLSQGLVNSLPETCNTREHFFWMLTVDIGIRTTRARLAWAEDAVAQLKMGKAPQE